MGDLLVARAVRDRAALFSDMTASQFAFYLHLLEAVREYTEPLDEFDGVTTQERAKRIDDIDPSRWEVWESIATMGTATLLGRSGVKTHLAALRRLGAINTTLPTVQHHPGEVDGRLQTAPRGAAGSASTQHIVNRWAARAELTRWKALMSSVLSDSGLAPMVAQAKVDALCELIRAHHGPALAALDASATGSGADDDTAGVDRSDWVPSDFVVAERLGPYTYAYGTGMRLDSLASVMTDNPHAPADRAAARLPVGPLAPTDSREDGLVERADDGETTALSPRRSAPMPDELRERVASLRRAA